jgi:hypothetical protein
LPVTDNERAIEIERLRAELAEARARRAALKSEAIELTARLPEIRAAFGNPFFYSHPEHADESIANYTGNSSHEVGLETFLALNRVDREARALEKQLRALNVDGD